MDPVVATLLQDGSSSYTETDSPSYHRSAISRQALQGLLRKGKIIHSLASKAVTQIAPEVVVKTSRTDDTTEVMNLKHVRTNPGTILVPETLGMLLIARSSYYLTIFIPGIPLELIWSNLTPSQKRIIHEQLNRYLEELRFLPIPSSDGYLGDGIPPLCKDTRRWSRRSTSQIVNESHFNDFLLSETLTSLESIRPCLRANHRMIMTHGDLHPQNIIVNNEEEVNITGIIDWENGGGYPEYWEYVKALHTVFFGSKTTGFASFLKMPLAHTSTIMSETNLSAELFAAFRSQIRSRLMVKVLV